MNNKEIKITSKFFRPKKVTKKFAYDLSRLILSTENGKGWIFIYQTFDNKWGAEYVTTLHKKDWNRSEQNIKYKFYAPIKEEQCQRSKEILEHYKGNKEDRINYTQKLVEEYTGGVWNLTENISDKNLEVLCSYQKYLPYNLNSLTIKDMGMDATKPVLQKVYRDLIMTYDKYLNGD